MTNPYTTLDLRGYRCPVPVVKAESALRQATPGAVFEILAAEHIHRTGESLQLSLGTGCEAGPRRG